MRVFQECMRVGRDRGQTVRTGLGQDEFWCRGQAKGGLLSSSWGTFMIDPPTTMPRPKPFEREYLRHSTSARLRSSTIEV